MASRRRRPSCVLVAGDPRPDARKSGGEDEQHANTWFSRGQWACLRRTRIADGRIGAATSAAPDSPSRSTTQEARQARRCVVATWPGQPARPGYVATDHPEPRSSRDDHPHRKRPPHPRRPTAQHALRQDRRHDVGRQRPPRPRRRRCGGGVQGDLEGSLDLHDGCESIKTLGCSVKRRFGRCEPEIHSLGLAASTLTRDRSARTRPAR
jgi:hypothetical protein